MATLTIRGVQVWKGLLGPREQADMVRALREVIRKAPLFVPVTPSGKPMSVRMSAAGQYGWLSGPGGYQYADRHPDGGQWPAIPEEVLGVWRRLVTDTRMPECCLINFYGSDARLGMHQDKDEADFSWPVVSISLGDDALFRLGNLTRGGKTESVWLNSGDVVVMGGDSRLIYHGIGRVRPGSSQLLSSGGRINLTLRMVT